MRTEPLFFLGALIALAMIVFYIGILGFMLVCILRDFIHRKDGRCSCDKDNDRP